MSADFLPQARVLPDVERHRCSQQRLEGDVDDDSRWAHEALRQRPFRQLRDSVCARPEDAASEPRSRPVALGLHTLAFSGKV